MTLHIAVGSGGARPGMDPEEPQNGRHYTAKSCCGGRGKSAVCRCLSGIPAGLDYGVGMTSIAEIVAKWGLLEKLRVIPPSLTTTPVNSSMTATY